MIELFDRVKLIEPYKLRSNVANELIPAGTVGTYRKDMKDSCIIQIDETIRPAASRSVASSA